MKSISPQHSYLIPSKSKVGGFSIIELMVAMAIVVIIGMGIVMYYGSQSRAYRVQRELSHMQQNLRAAMYMMQNDIRNSGRDPQRSGRYGIRAVARANNDADDPNGYPTLTMTSLVDTDRNGSANNDTVQTIVYQVRDTNGDGRRDLERCINVTGGAVDCQLIVDGIEDIGFAFACADGNGDLVRSGGADTAEVWAIDTNDNNDLDANADTDGDGDIEETEVAPVNLATNLPLTDIRVVRIWLLARSRQQYPDYTDGHTYVLGRKVLDMTAPANANRQNFRHFLLSGAVALQNYQLDTNL